jgi:lipopolysaccharide/colanic/teichoic acid biosynthesis glycosyltransferase
MAAVPTPVPGLAGSARSLISGSIDGSTATTGWLVAVYAFLVPFLAGLPRGFGLPLLRPSEAVQLAVTAVAVAAALSAVSAGRRIEVTLSPVDRAMLAMTLAGSVLPLLWLATRSEPLGPDQVLAAMAFVKYGALYALVRVAVRTEADRALVTMAVVAAASILSIVAVAQALGVGPIVDVLGRFFVSSADDVVDGGRATTTIGSSIATGAYLAMAFGLALSKSITGSVSSRSLVATTPPMFDGLDLRWLGVAGLTLAGALASGQIGTVLALAVVVITVTAIRGRLDLLVSLGVPASVVAVVGLWPVVAGRLADIDGRSGLPESWVVRWNNLTELFWPDLAANGWWLGVSPETSTVPPDVWREVVYLESGYLALLWVGGLPLLAAGVAVLVTAWRALASSTTDLALAARAAVAMVAVLGVIDPHLTLRVGADTLYVLVAAAVPAAPLLALGPDAATRWRSLLAADRRSTAWTGARLQLAENRDGADVDSSRPSPEMVLDLLVADGGPSAAGARLALYRNGSALDGVLLGVDADGRTIPTICGHGRDHGVHDATSALLWRASVLSARSLRLRSLEATLPGEGPVTIDRWELRRAGTLARKLEMDRSGNARSVGSTSNIRGLTARELANRALKTAQGDEGQGDEGQGDEAQGDEAPAVSSPIGASAIRMELGRSTPYWKRTLDLTVGALALVVTSPLWLVATVAARRSDGPPVLYRQIRIGAGGLPFQILKFRTMYLDNDDSDHREQNLREIVDGAEAAKDDDDPRITPAGRWLRKLSLDELPQLINVMRSEMSLVGPRPSLVWESELFQPSDRRRLTTRPGLTGLWQVSGRADVSMAEMLELDLDYVDRISPRLDLVCLSKTATSVLTQRGAR